MLRATTAMATAFGLFITAPTALALDEAHARQAERMIGRAIDYLRSQQDAETGGWIVREEGPRFPGITGLVVRGMIMSPQIDETDPAISAAVAYMLSYRQPDGGIYDRVLASYNTSLCLSALAEIHRPQAAATIVPAQRFLRGLQWSDQALDGRREVGRVGPEHPFYGGVGYGSHGRPDNSNLSLMLQALHDSGLSADDPAFERALTFLERTQMHDSVNDMEYADGSRQGGFIYATGPEKDQIDIGESKAGVIEETLPDGRRVSRLRSYGSMTYAGFKSYIYADLDRDDPRVRLAYDWLRRNYTLEENPGVGHQGFYYYLLTMSRALDAWGLPYVQTLNADGALGEQRDWANDLISRLAELQNENGSFQTLHERWMEGEPVLITAYALLALQHAVK